MPRLLFVVAFTVIFHSAIPNANAAEPNRAPNSTKSISVANFGAIPGDGKNDADGLRAAAKHARENPGTTVAFPPGIYDLRDEAAVKIQDDWMTSKLKGNPVETLFLPYAPHVRGLDFSGARDVTIDATGAVLLCDGWMEPVSLVDCERVTLIGLTIDYKRKPFSEGIITAIGNGTIDVRFRPEFPVAEGMPMSRMMVWDVAKDRLTGGSAYNPGYTVLAPQTLRIQSGSLGGKLGDVAMIVHGFHARPAIFINNAREIALTAVAIHAQEGMGIVGNRVHNLTVKRLRVVPAAGFRQSTNTDATHYTSCTGLLRYEDCEFKGQGDDAINVHNFYQEITKNPGGNRCEAKVPLWYTHAGVLDDYDVGDTIELVARDTLKPERTYKVVAVSPFPKEWRQELTLDDGLPADTGKYYLVNATRFPRVEMVRCTMHSHLARSVLMKTRQVLIEDCTFNQCTGTAVHVGAEGDDWKESGPCDNLVIRRCRFIRNGRGDGTVDGACAVAVQLKAQRRGVPGIHGKILIEDNVIEGENAARGISVTGADDVTVRNNTITGCKDPVKVEACNKVNVDGNAGKAVEFADPMVKPAGGEKIQRLGDLDLGLMTAGYGRPLANGSLGGGSLQIAGKAYKSGIATHASSDFHISLDGMATRFTTVCGVDDDSLNTGASVRFSIIADGKKVWESPVMKGGTNGVEANIPLAGVKLLLLRVDDAGDGISSDHADWASASILYTGKPPAPAAAPAPSH